MIEPISSPLRSSAARVARVDHLGLLNQTLACAMPYDDVEFLDEHLPWSRIRKQSASVRLASDAVLAESWIDRNVNVLTIVLAVVGIVITIAAGWLGVTIARRIKTIDWTILADQRMPTAHNGGPTGMTVSLSGEEIAKPRLVSMRIFNSGNAEVLPGDFHGEFCILNTKGSVVDASVVGVSNDVVPPPGLSVDPPFKVIIQPRLFNRRDYIDVQLVIDEARLGSTYDFIKRGELEQQFEGEDIVVSAAIAGQKRPPRRKGPTDIAIGAESSWFRLAMSADVRSIARIGVVGMMASMLALMFQLFGA